MTPPRSARERDIAHHLHAFTDPAAHERTGPLVIERGEGVYLIDEQGRRYLDGMASLWCCALGYNEPRLIEAAHRQLKQLPYSHTFRGRSHPAVSLLAEALLGAVGPPQSKAFFANSGSEANETAVKLAWFYNAARGRPEKRKIITREGAYHGTTVLAAALCGLPAMHEGFGFSTDCILRARCPHYYREARPGESEAQFASRLAQELDDLILAQDPATVAAFIAEPVMGVGGVIVPPAGYFEKIRPVLQRHDVLLIADEVICAFGRTGNFLGSETVGMRPDIITLAKALSSAYMPISATLVSERVYRAVRDEAGRRGIFSHGLTYSGHPVAAAVALEALAIYRERDIVGHVRTVGEHLRQGLQQFAARPLVGEVRGVGLMHAVELVADKSTREPFAGKHGLGAFLMDSAERQGLFVRAVGDTVIVAPPLIITKQEVDQLLRLFDAALRETESHAARLPPA